MSDGQPQSSESIDDAIREAERKLEQRIAELRTMATADDDVELGSAQASHEADPWWDEANDAGQPAGTASVSNLTPSGSTTAQSSSWSDAELRPTAPASTRTSANDDAWPRTGGGLTPEETEFWAQTRTALRLLQQSTDQLRQDLPLELSRRVTDTVGSEFTARLSQQIGGAVVDNVERIVHDEFTTSNAQLRQIQQSIPEATSQIQRTLGQELEVPTATLRQLQDDLPAKLDRVERNLERVVVEDLGRQLHDDVVGVNHALRDVHNRLERTVVDGYDRIDRTIGAQFDHVSETMQTELSQVQTVLRAELDAPLVTLKELHDELPGHFIRVEKAVRDTTEAQRHAVDTTRGDLLDLRSVIVDLTESQRASLEKLSEVTGDLDRERVQRAEDLETTLDTMTVGWQGVLKTVTKLAEQTEAMERRLDAFERSLAGLGALETTVGEGLADVRSQLDLHLGNVTEHLQALQPAPVAVTVQHPDAMVQQQTAPGFRREEHDAATAGGHRSSGRKRK